MPSAETRSILQFGILLLLLAARLTTQAQNNFEWKDASGKIRNRSDLEEILNKHKQWLLESERQSGSQADLRRAELEGADLSSVNLSCANLSGAHLNNADLSSAKLANANLNEANLTKANLTRADLTKAILFGADLSNAKLTNANLSSAELSDGNLSNAKLSNANLTQASLDDAKLGNASLDYANLIKADLYRADLSNAFLGKANLTDAHLAYANLTDAKVTRTNLTRADLTSANLTRANLFYVNLAGAYLGQADLSGALFFGANLEAAVFEANSLPPLIGISQSANLELVTYRDNPVALVQLRKQFEDGGLRDDERKITYALKRRETELSWVRATSPKLPTQGGAWAMLWSLNNRLSDLASFILNKVFFDWTCQYGMRPGRALRLGVALWFLCSFLYFACIHVPDWGPLSRVSQKHWQ
jgi:uncharacterized protein YjbI with pentapeptide repeats